MVPTELADENGTKTQNAKKRGARERTSQARTMNVSGTFKKKKRMSVAHAHHIQGVLIAFVDQGPLRLGLKRGGEAIG